MFSIKIFKSKLATLILALPLDRHHFSESTPDLLFPHIYVAFIRRDHRFKDSYYLQGLYLDLNYPFLNVFDDENNNSSFAACSNLKFLGSNAALIFQL
jgi:hypothetical protein